MVAAARAVDSGAVARTVETAAELPVGTPLR